MDKVAPVPMELLERRVELLVGQPPFHTAGRLDVEGKRSVDPARLRERNPVVNAELERICLNCLGRDPASRYATAEALAGELRHFLLLNS